eukprot:1181434-Amphidinium_carterae.2
MVDADDLHGNGHADVLANQGTAQGPLDPDATWTRYGLTLRIPFLAIGGTSASGRDLKMSQGSGYRPSLLRKYLMWDLKGWFFGSSIPNGTAPPCCETRCLSTMPGLWATNG